MPGNNIYQGQLQGPFTAGQNLMGLIKQQCKSDVRYVKHLGIYTPTDNVVINPGALIDITVDGNRYTVEVGKTNVYEIGNTKVTQIAFKEDKDNNTIVDYTVELK